MKNRKVIKIIIMIVCFIMLCNNVYASVINTSSVNIDLTQSNMFDSLGSTIVSIIRVLGMIISVGALMIMGIRYMTSSVEEKALEKESMIFYCIGAFLLFSVVNIVSAIYDWVSTI